MNSSNHQLEFQNANVFPKLQQQQLCYCSYFPKPLYLQKIKQHGPSLSHEERIRRLDKNIPQDIEINWDNDWYAEDNKEYKEIS